MNDPVTNRAFVYDANVLKRIVSVIKTAILNGAIFIPADTYLDVVSDVTDPKTTEKHTESDNLIIGHIGFYNGIDEKLDITFDKFDCMNYIHELIKYSPYTLDKYIWVKSPLSNPICTANSIAEKTTVIYSKEMEKINDNIKYDIVYFIKDAQKVPYEYLHIYDIISDLLNDYSTNHTTEKEVHYK
jgi:hypothetical protein